MPFKKPEKTKQPDSLEHAYNYCLFILGLSMRTEAEVRRKMKLRGYNPDVIDQIIQQLHEEKLIDDRNYTEVYLRNLKEYRTFGYYGIRKKLMEKQLPKEYIEELLEQDFSLDDEKKIAKKLIEKELGSDYKKSSLSQEQKQKLGQKLRMRGFRSDVISKLLF